MPAGKHDLFVAPADRNSKLWRYMDFAKFVALLEDRELYFARADLLGDPFEGSLSAANQKLAPDFNPDLKPEHLAVISNARQMLLRHTYISCWHMNEYESAAMWKLYAQTNEAIAVQTTFDRLFNLLPEECYLGMVYYADYQRDWIPEGDAFSPFLHKRKSFEHEHEVRALHPPFLRGKPEGIDLSQQTPKGVRFPIAPAELIIAVSVAPTSSEWFLELVKKLAKRYGLPIEPTRSALDGGPIY